MLHMLYDMQNTATTIAGTRKVHGRDVHGSYVCCTISMVNQVCAVELFVLGYFYVAGFSNAASM